MVIIFFDIIDYIIQRERGTESCAPRMVSLDLEEVREGHRFRSLVFYQSPNHSELVLLDR